MSASLHICIVDDLEDQLDIVSGMLQVAGYSTQCFSSGKTFLKQADFDKVDCLLLDNQMPDITGLEVQQNLKRRHIDIPIIFMSGGSRYGEVVDAVQEGALGFLQKPFTMHELLEQVQLALTSHKQNAGKNSNPLALLTPRETEVYNLVVAGHTNKAIARELSIAVSTVEFHRSNLVKKLGVSSLADLIKLA